MKRLIVSVLIVFAVSSAVAGPIEDGFAAMEQKDYATAARLWLPIAENAGAPVQFALGLMYYRGQGVPQDFGEAAKWDRKAANQGHAESQFILGMMYAQGEGVPKDYVQAHKWFSLAALRETDANKRTIAARNRDSIAKSMTSTQIAEAQRLAREWKTE